MHVPIWCCGVKTSLETLKEAVNNARYQDLTHAMEGVPPTRVYVLAGSLLDELSLPPTQNVKTTVTPSPSVQMHNDTYF